MRIALISDLHGNEAALDRVLEHASSEGVQKIICLGDVATLGPSPLKVIQRLAREEIPCVMGNHDAFLLDPALIHTYSESPVVIEAVDWCRRILPQTALDSVRGYESQIHFPLGDGRAALFYHGSPSSFVEDILPDVPQSRLEALLGPAEAEVFAGGHTHLQMARRYRSAMVINPGSVGCPFEQYAQGGPPKLRHHADYAIVDWSAEECSVELKSVEYPLAPYLEAIRARAAEPDAPRAYWEWLLGQYG